MALYVPRSVRVDDRRRLDAADRRASVCDADDARRRRSRSSRIVPLLRVEEAASTRTLIGHFARRQSALAARDARRRRWRSSMARTPTFRRRGTEPARARCRRGTSRRCTCTAASRLLRSPADAERVLRALVERFEGERRRRLAVLDAGQRSATRWSSSIAAFRIVIERVSGKFKLSQNRTPTDRRRVDRRARAPASMQNAAREPATGCAASTTPIDMSAERPPEGARLPLGGQRAAQGGEHTIDNAPPKLRIDKWLWAARFYKTRSSRRSVDAGQVRVNGERVKTARAVRAGERVDVRKAGFVWEVEVLGVADAAAAPDAAMLYAESEASRRAREEEVRAAARGRGERSRASGRPDEAPAAQARGFPQRAVSQQRCVSLPHRARAAAAKSPHPPRVPQPPTRSSSDLRTLGSARCTSAGAEQDRCPAPTSAANSVRALAEHHRVRDVEQEARLAIARQDEPAEQRRQHGCGQQPDAVSDERAVGRAKAETRQRGCAAPSGASDRIGQHARSSAAVLRLRQHADQRHGDSGQHAELAHLRHHRAEVRGGAHARDRLREQVHGAAADDAAAAPAAARCAGRGSPAPRSCPRCRDRTAARRACTLYAFAAPAISCAGTPAPSVRQLTPSVNSSSSRIARPSWFGIVRRRREQDLPRIARRTDQARHVAQQALREIGEAQLLEVLHFAAHDALVHGLVQRDQRLLEELAQALADEQLGQVVLQLADAMLRKELHGVLDLRRAAAPARPPPGRASTAAPSRRAAPPRRRASLRTSSCLMSLSRATWSGGYTRSPNASRSGDGKP